MALRNGVNLTSLAGGFVFLREGLIDLFDNPIPRSFGNKLYYTLKYELKRSHCNKTHSFREFFEWRTMRLFLERPIMSLIVAPRCRYALHIIRLEANMVRVAHVERK